MEKKQVEQKVECFVIMPISDQQGYDKGHFQLVYEDIIKPAIQLAGMIAVRADETKGANLIQLDILQKVIKLPIAVCDISSKNPNVFYELGIRQAFDMPTVILKDSNTEAPFDISGLRYCDYNVNMRYRDVKSAVLKLSEMLQETYRNKDNKSEINSLVRLLELSSPAELPSSDMSSQEKENKLVALKLETILESVETLSSQMQRLERDQIDNIFLSTQASPTTQQGSSIALAGLREQLRTKRKSIQPPSQINFDDDIPF
ncbi:hypothetical protein QGM67_18375 [Vibrio cholerae]|uniref:hypothetical protein n=1 Tax=Vibrio cholerae TaxID=666 RepID=UPI002478AF97|nr:hypothetical protein [Vibrio cholerae]MDH7616695.1 hypothetical protein [Vibrio cholerae]